MSFTNPTMKNVAEKPSVLVVDDEKVIRQLFQRTLREKDYSVETAENGNEALLKTRGSLFNLLIIDLKMPGISGVDVLKETKKANPYIEVIVITGYPTIDVAVEAIKIGAFDFICKPFDMAKLHSTIERCLERQKFNISHIQLSELMTLLEISKRVSAPSDLDSLLGRILDSALEITKATKGFLLLPDEKTKELNIKAARGLNKEIINKAKIRRVESLLEAPLISVPLHSRGDVMGMLGISNKISGEDFSEREQTILSVLAGQATVAIENTKLYKQLEERIEALKQTVKQLNQTQDQLIQTEKMAAVGKLAFGIAHEIRNPLAIILGGVEFLRLSLQRKDKLTCESIQKIKHCVDRANNIIIELLKFSKASELKLQPINICELLDSTIALIRNQANLGNIKISRNFPEKDIRVKADSNMLRQAFFNLCINAIDAMSKGGELYLDVNLEKGRRTNKNRVIVKVKDTGKGIPKDKLSKIFDPFFTTKEPGKGTGLGLSIVHLILERHNATIEVESQIGKGTTFIIKLPKTKEDKNAD